MVDTDKIPVVPVENDPEDLEKAPHLRNWRGDLYSQVISVIDEQGLLPWVLATADIVAPAEPEKSKANHSVSSKVVLTKTHQTRVIKRINAALIPTLGVVGAQIGGLLGPVAAATLGCVGAALGFLAWLFS